MAESVVRVCAQADIGPDSVKAYEVGDKRLAVYNGGGEYYVTDDECTHASASLADGILEDGVIECSLHFGAFDVKTGEVKAPPCPMRLRSASAVASSTSWPKRPRPRRRPPPDGRPLRSFDGFPPLWTTPLKRGRPLGREPN